MVSHLVAVEKVSGGGGLFLGTSAGNALQLVLQCLVRTKVTPPPLSS